MDFDFDSFLTSYPELFNTRLKLESASEVKRTSSLALMLQCKMREKNTNKHIFFEQSTACLLKTEFSKNKFQSNDTLISLKQLNTVCWLTTTDHRRMQGVLKW